MGKTSSKGLDAVVTRAESRLGKIAITGRFHKTPRVLADDYVVGSDVLGSGYNGSVYKASAKDGGGAFAVKEFKVSGTTSAETMAELEAECEIFLSLDHPHVARLTDIYQSNEKLTLVMECMEGGELFDRVIDRKKFSENDTADATYQMLLALNYLHSHGICHRDIKLENFLYEKKDTDHLKLIDFGFSKILSDPSIKMKMSCGTLSYVAPEVLSKSYTNKCDMWSLGVVVFILIAGYMPFSGSDSIQQSAIKRGAFTVKDVYKKISPRADHFIRSLIIVDSHQRLSAEQALQHEFIMKRSDRAIAAANAGVDDSTAAGLCHFAQASKFRRACLSAMAWSLTNDERAKLRDDFLAMDTTQSGTITLPEFKVAVEARFQLNDAQVKQMFDSVDTSNTQEIHYSEFLAAMVSSRVNLHDDLLRATFRRFDVENTGYIDKKDLETVLGESFEGAEVDALLAEADADGNGKISYQEFVEFAKADAAHDTKVTEVGHKIIDNERQKAEARSPMSHAVGSMMKAFKLR